MPAKDLPKEYSLLLDARGGDRRCCGVIAHALACNLTFREAQLDLKKQGRRIGCGTRTHQILDAVRSRGFTVRELPRLAQRYRTVRTLERGVCGKHTLLVFTARHVLVVKDGRVLDWTKNRLHRIASIYMVEK